MSLSADPQPDDPLIAAARAGDLDAFDELIELYRPFMRMVAGEQFQHHSRTKMDASDLVQDACLAASQKMDQFRGQQPREWMAWLRRIIRRRAINTRRNSHRVKRDVRRETAITESVGTAAARSPVSELVFREDVERLDHLIKSLPELQQRVLRLRNWDGLSYEEIGQKLGRSAEAARGLWRQSMTTLRSRLHS